MGCADAIRRKLESGKDLSMMTLAYLKNLFAVHVMRGCALHYYGYG